MITQPKKSILTSKKQQFRRQIRAQYLHNYMRKIRTQMQDSQQYQVLRNIIESLYSSEMINSENDKTNFQVKKLQELINFANQGKNSAIVALAELLLNKMITIEMIEALSIQETENTENTNNSSKKSDLMKILKFPAQNHHNQGWLALIRVLLNLNYCTQQMIIYCLRTISKNKSLQSIEFALQIVYILVIDKRMVKVQQIVKLMVKNNDGNKEEQTSIQEKLLVENFFDSLMKFSLKSTALDESRDIMYYATKILCRCFSSETILEDTIIKKVPLVKIVYFLGEKFNIQSTWQQTKALIMTNDLLVGLKGFNVYKVEQVIAKMLPLLRQVSHLIHVLTENLCLKNQGQLGYSRTLQTSTHTAKQQKELIKFLQEAVYLIQILVDDYLFSHNSISLTNQMLEKLTLQLTLEKLYGSFAKQVHQLTNRDAYFDQRDYGGSLSPQEEGKSWIVENSSRIAKNLQEKLIVAGQSVNGEDQSNEDFEKIEKFLSLQRLIIVRLRESQISSTMCRSIQEKEYQI